MRTRARGKGPRRVDRGAWSKSNEGNEFLSRTEDPGFASESNSSPLLDHENQVKSMKKSARNCGEKRYGVPYRLTLVFEKVLQEKFTSAINLRDLPFPGTPLFFSSQWPVLHGVINGINKRELLSSYQLSRLLIDKNNV